MVKDEKVSAEQTVRDIRRQTRRKYNTEEKIRIVVEGLRGEASVAELCRREGINPNLYYKWSKEFLEAGKARLAGDTKRQATSDEVSEIRLAWGQQSCLQSSQRLDPLARMNNSSRWLPSCC